MLLQDYYIDSKSILQKHFQKVNHLHKQKYNGSLLEQVEIVELK